MGVINGDSHPAFTIPTVDISGYLQDPKSSQADAIVEQIRNACISSGFFQITGHGVPRSLQAAVLDAAKALFSLPYDKKAQLSGIPGRGYEIIGSQVLEEGKKPDLKEGYFMGREISGNKPPYRPFQHPNIWPSRDVIPENIFQQPLLEYHQALSALSLQIMHMLWRGLKKIDTRVLSEFCHEPIAAVRLLHYPPHPETDDTSLVGAGAHTDFGAITLLLQDGNSGLQVLDQSTQEWIDVSPNQDAYVVNVGDMLQIWTGGAYKSNIHRVINKSGTDRYSVPFFLDGNLDCVIKPLDGSNGESITVEQHMQARYAASYQT